MARSTAFLGASTKTFKSYGKRKNHTTNTKQATLWDSSPEAALRSTLTAKVPATSHPSLNSPVSAAESSSSDEDSPPPKPTQARAPAVSKVPAAGLRRRAAAATSDKENHPAPSNESPRRPVFSRAKSRIVIHSPVKARRGKTALAPTAASTEEDSDPTTATTMRRMPLKPRFLGVDIVVASKTTRKSSPLSAQVHVDGKAEETSEESEPPVVRRPVRRAGKGVARVQDSSEEVEIVRQAETEFATRPHRTSGRASRARASVESSAEVPVRASRRSAAKQVPVEEATEAGDLELEESSGPAFDDLEAEEEVELEDDGSDVDQLASEEETLPTPLLPAKSLHALPVILDPLLSITGQSSAFDFTSFVSAPRWPFASRSATAPPSQWTKIGEASYSEVFESEGMVVKIIPVASKEVDQLAEEEEDDGEDTPYMSDWSSVQREMQISQLMGGERAVEGFVGFNGCASALTNESLPTLILPSLTALSSCRAHTPRSSSLNGTPSKPLRLPSPTSRSAPVRLPSFEPIAKAR